MAGEEEKRGRQTDRQTKPYVGRPPADLAKNGHQANRLGTPQNNLETPLGVPTPTLGTTDLRYKVNEQVLWAMVESEVVSLQTTAEAKP